MRESFLRPLLLTVLLVSGVANAQQLTPQCSTSSEMRDQVEATRRVYAVLSKAMERAVVGNTSCRNMAQSMKGLSLAQADELVNQAMSGHRAGIALMSGACNSYRMVAENLRVMGCNTAAPARQPAVAEPAIAAQAPQAATPSKPSANLPPALTGQQYSAARERLLASGWEPYRARDADHCERGDERCQGRPEMQSCSGSGRASCRFLWRKNGVVATVTTAGEVRPTVVAVEEDSRPVAAATAAQPLSQAPQIALPDRFAPSKEACAGVREAVMSCSVGGWGGSVPSTEAAFMDDRNPRKPAMKELAEAINHLYDNGQFRIVQDIYDAGAKTCKSVINVRGQYKGSSYSVELYCDKTYLMGSRLKYLRDQTPK